MPTSKLGHTWGIHIVWTAYMTWLPGDPRGHWAPLLDMYARVVERGGRLQIGDAATAKAAAESAKGDPVVLDSYEMEIVARTVGEVIVGGAAVGTKAGIPAAAWRVYAAAIEPTHIHLLMAPGREDVSLLIGRIKGKSSSQICRRRGASCKRTWTAGAWPVFLFDERAMHAAREYIVRHNTRRGLPADPYPWITSPALPI